MALMYEMLTDIGGTWSGGEGCSGVPGPRARWSFQPHCPRYQYYPCHHYDRGEECMQTVENYRKHVSLLVL